MLKSAVRKRLISLYSDIISYAQDNAEYIDCDQDCDGSYMKDINRFNKRFLSLLQALDKKESYTK